MKLRLGSMLSSSARLCLAVGSLSLAACASSQPKAEAPYAYVDRLIDSWPEQVTVEGAPGIPASFVAALEPYLEVKATAMVGVHPEGGIVVSSRIDNAAQLYRMTEPKGELVQLTKAVEPARSAKVLADGQILFLRDSGGNEAFQLYRLGKDLSETLLTDGKGRVAGYCASTDGQLVAWNSNSRNGRDMDIWVKEGEGQARLALEVKGHWTPLDISPDGKWVLLQEWISIADQRLHVLDVKGGGLVSLSRPQGAHREAAFTPSGDGILMVTDVGEGREFLQLDVLQLPAKATWKDLPKLDKLSRQGALKKAGVSTLLATSWDIEAMTLSPSGKDLFVVTNEDGFSVLTRHSLTQQGESQRYELPQGVASNPRVSADGSQIALTLQTPTRTGEAITIDVASGAVTYWSDAYAPKFTYEPALRAELVRVTSFDGRSIPAFLYRPEGDIGPFPVVIDIHGGPEGQSRPVTGPLTQFLVQEQRIAVLVPNVRGSDGYGKTYLGLDNGMKREDSVRDIGAFLDFIVEDEGLDASRVAVIGGSYGGYMVLASLVHFAERLKAGIDVVGISNFVTFLENTSEYRRDLRRVEYGDERDPAMRAHLEAISPLNHADKIKSALFVAHGANDPRVPLSEAEQVIEKVRGQGQEVWKFVAHDEGHGFAKRKNRDAYVTLAAYFLTQQLLESGR